MQRGRGQGRGSQGSVVEPRQGFRVPGYRGRAAGSSTGQEQAARHLNMYCDVTLVLRGTLEHAVVPVLLHDTVLRFVPLCTLQVDAGIHPATYVRRAAPQGRGIGLYMHDVFEALATHARNIEELQVVHYSAQPDVVRFAAIARMGSLRSLDLRTNVPTNAMELEQLSAGPQAGISTTLRALDLSDSKFDDPPHCFAAIGKLIALQKLELHATSIPPGGFEQLGCLHRLEHLNLAQSDFAGDVSDIAKLRSCSLACLDLSKCVWATAAIAAPLMELRRLRTLRVADSPIDDETAAILRAQFAEVVQEMPKAHKGPWLRRTCYN